jgi:hypothetical protein
MNGLADAVDVALNELRHALAGLDGRSQLKLLNQATASAARLRVEIDAMRAEALERLVRDVQHETVMEHPA